VFLRCALFLLSLLLYCYIAIAVAVAIAILLSLLLLLLLLLGCANYVLLCGGLIDATTCNLQLCSGSR
jgi:hypothetical protein